MISIQRLFSPLLLLFVISFIFADSVTAASVQEPDSRDGHLRLRSTYRDLPVASVQAIQHIAIHEKKEWGFYGHSTINHDYELRELLGDKVVIDHATGLMWHQSGSTFGLNWYKAKRWVEQLNREGYGGYNDWRLPTIEEASSLLEPSKTFYYAPPKAHEHSDKCYKKVQCENVNLDPCDRCRNAHNCYIVCCSTTCYDVTRCDVTTPSLNCSNNYVVTVASRKDTDRFIDPVFDKTQGWIWTGDSFYQLDAAWRVDFFHGLVDWDVYPYRHYYIRPVRNIYPYYDPR